MLRTIVLIVFWSIYHRIKDQNADLIRNTDLTVSKSLISVFWSERYDSGQHGWQEHRGASRIPENTPHWCPDNVTDRFPGFHRLFQKCFFSVDSLIDFFAKCVPDSCISVSCEGLWCSDLGKGPFSQSSDVRALRSVHFFKFDGNISKKFRLSFIFFLARKLSVWNVRKWRL